MKLKSIFSILIFFIMLMIGTSFSNAANYSINATSYSASVGDKVTVNVSIIASAWNISVSGDKIKGESFNGVSSDLSETTINKSYSFDTSKEGTYNVTISGDITGTDGNPIPVNKIITIVVKTASKPTTPEEPAKKSSEARLSNIWFEPKEYDFSGFKRDKTEYSVEVPNEAKEITVKASTVNSKAKVSGTGKVSLKEGNNTIKLTVTAEDGTKKTYTLNVNRLKTNEQQPEEKPQENTTNEETQQSNETDNQSTNIGENVVQKGLSNLTIENIQLSPKFSSNVYEYTVGITEDLSSLQIKTTLANTEDSVEIAGNENLKEGENIITILVTSKETGEVTTYQIIVNKNITKEEIKASWFAPATWGKEEKIVISIIGVLVLIIIVSIIIKIKIAHREEEEEFDLPGGYELDKALIEHQELNGEDEENEKESIREEFYRPANKKGKHF